MNGLSLFEADLPVKVWGNAFGFEVKGTLSVREPGVLDVVNKPLHKVWGSLKHSPEHHSLVKIGLVQLLAQGAKTRPKSSRRYDSRSEEII